MKSRLFSAWLLCAGIWLGYFGTLACVNYLDFEKAKTEVAQCQRSSESEDEPTKAIEFNACFNSAMAYLRHEGKAGLAMRRAFGNTFLLLILFALFFYILGGFRKK